MKRFTKMNREGKVSIVTGAASGLGRGIAKGIAAEGSCVVLADKNAVGMQETVQMILDAGGSKAKILQIVTDVSSENDCKSLMAKTIEKFDHLDVLVNCAGILVLKPFMETTVEDFQKLFSINMLSVFMLSKEAVPHLAKTKGNIVNISSSGSRIFSPVLPAYCATKAAVDHMSRTFAMEIADKGIRVNTINPSFVETNVFKGSNLSDEEYKSMQDWNLNMAPLKRHCTVDEVVQAALFLSSDRQSSYVNAMNLFVDGGFTAMAPGTSPQ